MFSSDSDTELIVHLYEEYGEDLFDHLKGQFAFVLVDFARSLVLLGRDRVGICPLHWSRQGDRLYFGSEIKALFASGAVQPAIDPRGLDHIFTFFAMGSQRTMFAGVQSLRPGHYMRIAFRNDGTAAEIEQRCYWDLDFPDWGDEDDPHDESALVDEFEAVFSRAVEIRLRAEVCSPSHEHAKVAGHAAVGVDRDTGHDLLALVEAEPLHVEVGEADAVRGVGRGSLGRVRRAPARSARGSWRSCPCPPSLTGQPSALRSAAPRSAGEALGGRVPRRRTS